MSTTVDRQFISTLLDAVRDGVIVQDARGEIVDANEPFCRMVGYARDELVGRAPPFPFWQGGDAPRSAGGGADLVHKDGRALPVVVTSRPMNGDDRMVLVVAVVAAAADGSASQRRDERPRDTEALSQAVLDSHPAQIAVLDRDGNIIAINEAWRRFARENGGGERTGCIGTNYLTVCNGAAGEYCDEAPAVVRGIHQVLRGELPKFELEYPCHGHDCERWFLLTAAPLRHASGGAIVSHLDISQRKMQEEELRRRADELDQFAYVTSHDLRAPLRGIANLAAWIEEDLGPQALTPESKKMLELLRGRVTRMEGLIAGILEYARAGRTKPKVTPIDVNALLNETVDLLAPPPGTVEIRPDLPSVETDRVQFQQVFLNLIGNAIKHAGRTDPHVIVSGRAAGPRYVEFAVSDNGQGIDPQYHERIFAIFQTLAPRDKVEGSGVGLSLVRKIVESFGGRVWVESQGRAGEGATFRFTWPRVTARTQTMHPTPKTTTATKGA